MSGWNTVGILAIAVSLLVGLILRGVYFVDEGFVGVTYRGGALLKEVASPDEVVSVPCGTSGGVVLIFERVEVVNILEASAVYSIVKNYTADYDKPLIYDRVHHEINQFCSSHSLQEVYIDLFDQIDENLRASLQANLNHWAPGLTVRDVRVTKPRLPEVIKDNYVKMESQKTMLMIATQEQKVVEKKAETERKQAIIEAEKEAAVSKIRFEQKIMEEESKKAVSLIDDATRLARQRSLADADYYSAERKAQANKLLLTPEYLELMKYQSLAANEKIYFGASIPDYFVASGHKEPPIVAESKSNQQ